MAEIQTKTGEQRGEKKLALEKSVLHGVRVKQWRGIWQCQKFSKETGVRIDIWALRVKTFGAPREINSSAA
jgi:hypothetical protein